MHAPRRAIDHVSPETASRYLAEFDELGARAYRDLSPDELRDLRYRIGFAVANGNPIVVTPREAYCLLMIADPPGVPIEDLISDLLTSQIPASVPTQSKVPPSALPHLAAGDAALARGDYGAAADAIDRATVEIRRGGA